MILVYFVATATVAAAIIAAIIVVVAAVVVAAVEVLDLSAVEGLVHFLFLKIERQNC